MLNLSLGIYQLLAGSLLGDDRATADKQGPASGRNVGHWPKPLS